MIGHFTFKIILTIIMKTLKHNVMQHKWPANLSFTVMAIANPITVTFLSDLLLLLVRMTHWHDGCWGISRWIYMVYNSIWSGTWVAQLYPTLWDPMNCSPIGSSVCGVFQARILEWVAIPFSRSSWTQVSCIAGIYIV